MDNDYDAYAVLNWLAKYYERNNLHAKAEEIRKEIDRISDMIRRNQQEAPAFDLIEIED